MDIKGKDRIRLILAVILIASVGLRVASAIVLGDKIEILPGIFDQISYHTLANRLLSGNGFTFDQQWWPATRAGEPTAHWSYLYTLYLAAIYRLFGNHPLIARLIQAMVSGILMPLLAFRISRRTFSHREKDREGVLQTDFIGLIAAAWTAVYPYFIYYASALMTETYYIVGILWTMDCGLRIGQEKIGKHWRDNWKIWVELGAAIGVTILLRQVFLIWVPFLFFWLSWTGSGKTGWNSSIRNVAAGGLLSAVIIAILIGPFTLLNYAQFKRFVLLNNNAGYAFFWANHPIHKDFFIPLLTAEMPSYQDLIPPDLRSLDEAALDQALLKAGFEFVKEDPGRYIRLSVSRIPVYFNFWPAKDSSLPSNLTRVFSLGIAIPFMIAGIIIWAKRTRRDEIYLDPGLLLISFLILYSAVHILSWAQIRYRLPVDAVMLVFAAQAMASIPVKLGFSSRVKALLSPELNMKSK